MIWRSRVLAPGDGDIMCGGGGRCKEGAYSNGSRLNGIKRIVIPMEWNKGEPRSINLRLGGIYFEKNIFGYFPTRILVDSRSFFPIVSGSGMEYARFVTKPASFALSKKSLNFRYSESDSNFGFSSSIIFITCSFIFDIRLTPLKPIP